MIAKTDALLTPADFGDKILIHFMLTKLPTGFSGLLLLTVLAATMSTISAYINASATVFTEDIYKIYFNKYDS